jgi:DNA-binding FrmR family transcriptional regulator
VGAAACTIIDLLALRLPRVTPARSIPIYPPPVSYQGAALQDAARQTVLSRLKRIEGQVGGLMRMIDEDRYCVDILTQIHAVRAALHKVEEQVLRDHVAHCVADAFSSGDVLDRQRKVEELIGAIGRMTR